MNNNRYHISSRRRATRKFLEVSLCGRAKQRQRNVRKKKCAARAKLFFCYLDLIGPFIREKIKAAAYIRREHPV